MLVEWNGSNDNHRTAESFWKMESSRPTMYHAGGFMVYYRFKKSYVIKDLKLPKMTSCAKV